MQKLLYCGIWGYNSFKETQIIWLRRFFFELQQPTYNLMTANHITTCDYLAQLYTNSGQSIPSDLVTACVYLHSIVFMKL